MSTEEVENDAKSNEMKEENEARPERENNNENEERAEQAEEEKKKGTVYVNNIPRDEDIKEEEIMELFKEFGEVDKVKIVLEHDGKRAKGYAFVDFKEADSAKACTESEKKIEFRGHELKVEQAHGGLKRKRSFNRNFERRPGGYERDSRPPRDYMQPRGYSRGPPRDYGDRGDRRGPPRDYGDRRGPPRDFDDRNPRYGGGRDMYRPPRDHRDSRDSRDRYDNRDRGYDSRRDNRDGRRDPRDSRDSRDPRDRGDRRPPRDDKRYSEKGNRTPSPTKKSRD